MSRAGSRSESRAPGRWHVLGCRSLTRVRSLNDKYSYWHRIPRPPRPHSTCPLLSLPRHSFRALQRIACARFLVRFRHVSPHSRSGRRTWPVPESNYPTMLRTNLRLSWLPPGPPRNPRPLAPPLSDVSISTVRPNDRSLDGGHTGPSFAHMAQLLHLWAFRVRSSALALRRWC